LLVTIASMGGREPKLIENEGESDRGWSQRRRCRE